MQFSIPSHGLKGISDIYLRHSSSIATQVLEAISISATTSCMLKKALATHITNTFEELMIVPLWLNIKLRIILCQVHDEMLGGGHGLLQDNPKATAKIIIQFIQNHHRQR
ncbi:hypothetical protein GCM10009007_15760 [Formosimonas limnophila]|uniref:Uncharacterized protein n=1 Tax=Formosimonas limnophila TaxID=1384487 RepID=A0A8J3G0K8_9BURK|nr:hypothetical protein [Formosimonas limnophila]GHA75458.1 hypothetical protein GCM10009007_15760 [Formosimonas limnophila]